MIKRLYFMMVLIAVLTITVSAAPKPGPKAIITIINKTPDQEGSIYLKGTKNFYEYYLTVKAYDVEKEAMDGTHEHLEDLPKSAITTYEVRQDIYEVIIISCGNSTNSGVIDLRHNTRFTFPNCKNDLYGKQAYINIRSICLLDPTIEKCKKEGYFLTVKGNKGETREVKVRRPPQVTDNVVVDLQAVFH